MHHNTLMLALQALTALPISTALLSSTERAIQVLASDIHTACDMAKRLFTKAKEPDIERALCTLQIIKGKTYAQVLEKNIGKCPPPEMADLGITAMLHKMSISQAELDHWYSSAEQTRYQFTAFSPLPDKAEAKLLLDEVRMKLLPKVRAAGDLIDASNRPAYTEGERLSPAAVRAAIDMGMWPLFFPHHKAEAFMLLQWHELPHEAKVDYFAGLAEPYKTAICALREEMREAATKKHFERKF